MKNFAWAMITLLAISGAAIAQDSHGETLNFLVAQKDCYQKIVADRKAQVLIAMGYKLTSVETNEMNNSRLLVKAKYENSTVIKSVTIKTECTN